MPRFTFTEPIVAEMISLNCCERGNQCSLRHGAEKSRRSGVDNHLTDQCRNVGHRGGIKRNAGWSYHAKTAA